MEEDVTEFLGTDGGQIADEVAGLTAAAGGGPAPRVRVGGPG